MKTLIVRYGNFVRLLVTNHPQHRFRKLQEQLPVQITLFGVTPVRAKEISALFPGEGLWVKLNDDFLHYLSSIIEE